MTSIVGSLRRSAVLLLAIGVLLMHASTASPITRAMPATGSVAKMVRQAEQQMTVVRQESASRSPSSGLPAGCGGGQVCRAVLTPPVLQLQPTMAATVVDVPEAPYAASVAGRSETGAPGPPSTRSRLQVWRC